MSKKSSINKTGHNKISLSQISTQIAQKTRQDFSSYLKVLNTAGREKPTELAIAKKTYDKLQNSAVKLVRKREDDEKIASAVIVHEGITLIGHVQ